MPKGGQRIAKGMNEVDCMGPCKPLSRREMEWSLSFRNVVMLISVNSAVFQRVPDTTRL